MNKMSDSLTRECLRIVDLLIESPASVVFRSPVDPVADNCPDYFKLITSPQDLSTIRSRLLNREYKTYPEWERDMNLIWANAQYYNGAKSVVGALAEAMADKFKKESRAIPGRYGSWVQKIDLLFQRLNKLVANPPGTLEPHIGHNEFQNPTSAKDLARLGRAASGLTHRNDMVQFIQLLTTLNVPFLIDGDELRVKSGEVSQFAAKGLIAFVKERLGAMGYGYPR
jgi:hypothetical protein